MQGNDPSNHHAAKFHSTHWSVVLAAKHQSSPDGRLALAQLCEKYWYPLYAHARRRESNAEKARDLVQGFFARMIEHHSIEDADPSRGKFRTFLLTAFQNFAANEWDKSNTFKRGGRHTHVSLDFDDGDHRYSREPIDSATPELRYHQLWARSLLKLVLDQLRDEYRSERKKDLFNELRDYLTIDSGRENYAQVAKRLNLSEGAIKVAVYRMRRRYRELLRQEIAHTVADPSDVEDEIRFLFATFSR